jgi:phospholipid N-methyltransferase
MDKEDKMNLRPAKPLANLIEKNQSKRVVEIGVLKGRTTRKILRSHCKDIIEEYWAMEHCLHRMA